MQDDLPPALSVGVSAGVAPERRDIPLAPVRTRTCGDFRIRGERQPKQGLSNATIASLSNRRRTVRRRGRPEADPMPQA